MSFLAMTVSIFTVVATVANNLNNNNNNVIADERCICTCPAFDIPNVAKSDRLVYIGHAENAQGCR